MLTISFFKVLEKLMLNATKVTQHLCFRDQPFDFMSVGSDALRFRDDGILK